MSKISDKTKAFYWITAICFGTTFYWVTM